MTAKIGKAAAAAALPEPPPIAEPGPVAVLDPKGRLRVPPEVWAALGLEPGVPAAWDVRLTPEGILFKPKAIDPDQWWFWTPEWQAGEREIDRARAEGRAQTRIHYSTEEFLAYLEQVGSEGEAEAVPDADARGG